MRAGFIKVVAATAIGGVAGYLITWLVPRVIGFDSYAEFAVFWGLLFLLVSALSGIQQEITRGTVPRGAAQGGTRAITFGVAAAAAALIAIVLSAFGWAAPVFEESGWDLVWPIAVGAASYVGVAVVGGVFYGTHRWSAVFWLVTVEAVLRLGLVVAVLGSSTSVVALAWAVAIPFPGTIIVFAVYLVRRVRGRAILDVSYPRLTWNVCRTMVASASMGLIVSGMPALLGVVGNDEPPATLGLAIITMTLTRAPLIVVAMALQSFFIVQFKAAGTRFWKVYATLSGVIAAGGVVLALLGFAWGPWVFGVLFPGEPTPSASFVAAMVLSSALVGLLCVSAPAVLARSQHFVYSLGWFVAAAVTILALALPIPFEPALLLALFCGPAAGLIVYVSYLIVAKSRDGR